MRKRKWWSIAAAVVLAAVLLVPVRVNLKDGGSVRYRALLYEVTKIHQLAPEVKGVKPYIDGFEVKLLGGTVTGKKKKERLSPSQKKQNPPPARGKRWGGGGVLFWDLGKCNRG